MFLNIRGKSVGEEVEVNIICPDDGETEVPVKINLDEIEVKFSEDHDKMIKLDDQLTMEMKYPSLDQFIKNNFDLSDDSAMDQSFEIIGGCIDKIFSADDVWAAEDCSREEINEFLEQMNSLQFTMPKLSHEIEVKNPKTKKKGTVVLEGLSSFFA